MSKDEGDGHRSVRSPTEPVDAHTGESKTISHEDMAFPRKHEQNYCCTRMFRSRCPNASVMQINCNVTNDLARNAIHLKYRRGICNPEGGEQLLTEERTYYEHLTKNHR